MKFVKYSSCSNFYLWILEAELKWIIASFTFVSINKLQPANIQFWSVLFIFSQEKCGLRSSIGVYLVFMHVSTVPQSVVYILPYDVRTNAKKTNAKPNAVLLLKSTFDRHYFRIRFKVWLLCMCLHWIHKQTKSFSLSHTCHYFAAPSVFWLVAKSMWAVIAVPNDWSMFSNTGIHRCRWLRPD